MPQEAKMWLKEAKVRFKSGLLCSYYEQAVHDMNIILYLLRFVKVLTYRAQPLVARGANDADHGNSVGGYGPHANVGANGSANIMVWDS
jgi:hypothetical protein